MLIKAATTLRNDYDGMVKLCREKHEPVFLTRNGEGELVIQTIEDWERREAELRLLADMLHRERNRLAGAKTFSADEMDQITEDMLREG